MAELNPEVVKAVQDAAAELQQELVRLKANAQGLAASRDALEKAAVALENAGAQAGVLSSRLETLAVEVSRLDPVSIAHSIDAASESVAGIRESVTEMGATLSGAKETLDGLGSLVEARAGDLAQGMSALSGLVRAESTSQRDAIAALREHVGAQAAMTQEAQQRAAASLLAAVGEAKKSSLEEVGEGHTALRTAVNRVLVVAVIGLLVSLASLVMWFVQAR